MERVRGNSDLKGRWMPVHVLKTEKHGEQERKGLFPL